MIKEYEYVSNVNNDIVVKVNNDEIKINSHVSLGSLIEIIERVVSNCFTEDGAYIPAIKDFLYKTYVIAYYSDVEIPKSVDEQYNLVVGTNLYDIISENVCAEQLEIIHEEIETCISNKLADISKKKEIEIDALTTRVNDFIGMLQPFVEEIEKASVNETDINLNGDTLNANRF